MKFIAIPLMFLAVAMMLIGLVHGDIWIAFSRFSTLEGVSKAACLFATFAGLFVALLKE